MKMLRHPVVACGAALLAEGCAVVRVPEPAAAVRFEVVSSCAVHVHESEFSMLDGHLDLHGTAEHAPGLAVPATAHVHITFRNADGATLRTDTVELWSPSVPPRGVPTMAKYHLHVKEFPEGTRRIEVRAHDESDE